MIPRSSDVVLQTNIALYESNSLLITLSMGRCYNYAVSSIASNISFYLFYVFICVLFSLIMYVLDFLAIAKNHCHNLFQRNELPQHVKNRKMHPFVWQCLNLVTRSVFIFPGCSYCYQVHTMKLRFKFRLMKCHRPENVK